MDQHQGLFGSGANQVRTLKPRIELNNDQPPKSLGVVSPRVITGTQEVYKPMPSTQVLIIAGAASHDGYIATLLPISTIDTLESCLSGEQRQMMLEIQNAEPAHSLESDLNRQLLDFSQAHLNPQENLQMKCFNYLTKLIELCEEFMPAVKITIRDLIQQIVDARISPRHFIERINILMNRTSNSSILDYMENGLPPLRQSLVLKNKVIKYINPPPRYVAFPMFSPMPLASVDALQNTSTFDVPLFHITESTAKALGFCAMVNKYPLPGDAHLYHSSAGYVHVRAVEKTTNSFQIGNTTVKLVTVKQSKTCNTNAMKSRRRLRNRARKQ